MGLALNIGVIVPSRRSVFNQGATWLVLTELTITSEKFQMLEMLVFALHKSHIIVLQLKSALTVLQAPIPL